MRSRNLFFMLLSALYCNAQLNETFTDGDFTQNPTWTGHTFVFNVNDDKKLQSAATSTSVSWLTTPSESINNAVWQCDFRIQYSTSASNYAAFYIIASDTTIYTNCNGYFVQIGGTNDEVSLFYQQGSKKTKIIDGTDKRTDGNPVIISVKVERDASGRFQLFSKLSTESEYYKEGEALHSTLTTSSFAGLLYSNTTTTGNAYFFDNIFVTGDKSVDKTAPQVISCKISGNSKLQFSTDEPIQPDKLNLVCDNAVGKAAKINALSIPNLYEAEFAKSFDTGVRYQFNFSNLMDIGGNIQADLQRTTGIIETMDSADIVLNEIMFHAPKGGQEYVEIINISKKLIDLSNLRIATRKSDRSLNSGFSVSDSYLMEPNEIVALALDPDSVLNYHQPIQTATILKTKSWSALNNESSTLVICNLVGDTIVDELTYSSKWHHILIDDKAGVALERIQPKGKTQDISNWHSAATSVHYGTPGYVNSQYFVSDAEPNENPAWCEPEAFSPNNDGTNDVCTIHFKPEYAGFVANVMVFSVNGNKIAQPAANYLLSANETIPWDGRTLHGTNVQTGMYAVYIEIFNPSNGYKIKHRFPVVVTSR